MMQPQVHHTEDEQPQGFQVLAIKIHPTCQHICEVEPKRVRSILLRPPTVEEQEAPKY
jgi:hypothetical protein